MNVELIKTDDGSNTLYLPEINESYHSRHGAMQEALHVFVKNGIEKWHRAQSSTSLNLTEKINVLEVGFGTGLNAMLTAEWAVKNNVNVDYSSLEPFPLDLEMNKALNFYQSGEISEAIFDEVLKAEWNNLVNINSNFSLNKLNLKLALFDEENKFDVIFYDAFGPRVQPELWNLESLKICFEALKNNGLWVTYCAQGQMKRNLKELGFTVQSLPGPPGKREMTIAYK